MAILSGLTGGDLRFRAITGKLVTVGEKLGGKVELFFLFRAQEVQGRRLRSAPFFFH